MSPFIPPFLYGLLFLNMTSSVAASILPEFLLRPNCFGTLSRQTNACVDSFSLKMFPFCFLGLYSYVIWIFADHTFQARVRWRKKFERRNQPYEGGSERNRGKDKWWFWPSLGRCQKFVWEDISVGKSTWAAYKGVGWQDSICAKTAFWCRQGCSASTNQFSGGTTSYSCGQTAFSWWYGTTSPKAGRKMGISRKQRKGLFWWKQKFR